MMSSTCGNCGRPKEPANYSDNYCPSCTTRKHEAEQHFAAEHPKATLGDILNAGRTALRQVAHSAHRNFVDPRAHAATLGMIPIPPQGGLNRGNPS
jgi:uncharacterized Zn finger protein (UPF0148 family)